MNPQPELLGELQHVLGPLRNLFVEVHDYIGLIRYLSLWLTVSIGLFALAVALWCNPDRRETIRAASRSTSDAPWRRLLMGLVMLVPPVLIAAILLGRRPGAPLGIVLLIATALGLVLPGIAVAALKLGNACSRTVGRECDDLRSLLVGLAILQGTGFLVYLGLVPWLFWVVGGVGGLRGAGRAASAPSCCQTEPVTSQPAADPPVR